MNHITFTPIGIIHTPFKETKGTPIQPPAAKGAKGYIEIFNEFSKGLKDLDGFSHIYVIFYFHKSEGYKLTVTPYLDNSTHGVFATRAPRRPNQIGISIVKLISVEQNKIFIEDVDIVDGTPLLDIKPYVPLFDTRENVKTGWINKSKTEVAKMKDDGRFSIST
jgi:tRNA-Thr(GGU) m(6)t(6)A37 methyltransferase TsaA